MASTSPTEEMLMPLMQASQVRLRAYTWKKQVHPALTRAFGASPKVRRMVCRAIQIQASECMVLQTTLRVTQDILPAMSILAGVYTVRVESQTQCQQARQGNGC